MGLRALPTFMVGFMPLLIFIGSFHNSASVWKVRRIDYACGAVSVAGTVVWLVTRGTACWRSPPPSPRTSWPACPR